MSAAQKLYRVHVEVSATVMVVATSADEAQRFAETDREVWDNELGDVESNICAVAREVTKAHEVAYDEDRPYLACDVTDDQEEFTSWEWFQLRVEAEKRAQREEEFKRRQLSIPGTEVTK